MAVNIPAAVNLHTSDPDTDARLRANFGTANRAVKPNGNLPISGNAGQWTITSANAEGGTLYEFLASGGYDVSSETKILVWQYQHNAPNRIQMDTQANNGLFIRISSGAGGNVNYRDYIVAASDLLTGGGMNGINPIVIDLNDSVTQDSSAGTFDNTDVQGYGIGQNYGVMAGSNSALLYVQRAHVFDTAKNGTNIVKFTGTSDFDDLIDAVLGVSTATKIGGWVQKLSDTYFVPVAFQIGDASTTTNFNDNGVTVVSPASNDANDPRYRLTNQAMRVYAVLPNNATNGTVTLSGTYSWGTAAPWDFDQNDAAVITIDGATFSGMGDFTLGSSVSGAATFSLNAAATVIINGADLDGSVINGDCELLTDTDLSDIRITGDLRVNIAADTTLNLTNVTVLGDVFNDATGNTLTINQSGGALTAGDAGTGNGQTNIVASNTLTITGVPTGGIFTIYDEDNADPQDLGTTLQGPTSTTGADITYVHSETNDPIALQFIKTGFKEVNIPFTLLGQPQSIDITSSIQVEDNL